MAVKMRPVDCRTKRPRGALLQLVTDLFFIIVENRREDFGPLVEYRSLYLINLTYNFWKRNWEQCLGGSFAGEVVC